MKVKVICRKFECRKDIHYKIETGTSCEKCNSKAFRCRKDIHYKIQRPSGWEWNPRPLTSVSSVVEHWSSNPEDAGSIPSRKALELHFSQLVPVSIL